MKISKLTIDSRANELTDSKGTNPFTVLSDPEPCKLDRALIHIRTSRGDWCIHRDQEVNVSS